MKGERDELVKRVFPRLRKLCEQRGVTWGEIDLRWGITDEQKAEGRVLPVCLEEIRRCRPYFIGLVGQRYGWVPDEIDAELVNREPWLVAHRGRSVTELEIVHGALNDPEMAEHSFFYLRDRAYVDSLPAEQQATFREGPTVQEIDEHGLEDAERRAQERQRKLAALKKRIHDSGLPVRSYADPQEAAELILADLTAVIDRLYPAGSEPDPLDREAAEHQAFARSRKGVYIGRQAYVDALDAHAAGNGQPLVVLGESGSGKSALLANWAIDHRSVHPDDAVVLHFIGSSPQSTDWAAMLRRILGELRRRFDLQLEIPDQSDALRAAFGNALDMAAARGRVVLILDALNQLDDREGAPDLVWLPPQMPPNVRLVLSTLPGRPLAELQRRGWPVLRVDPLEANERRELIVRYLAQYRKALSNAQTERVAGAPQSANPLFVRVLLEEVRLWGEHETLDERIDYYLAASTLPELYRLVLARWETDYERNRSGLVAETMSLLWAARRGLAEAELLDLLGTDSKPLPPAHWSPLVLAADQSLSRRAGLLGFAHDYLRQAVHDRYTETETQKQTAHLRLADYFDHRRDDPRAVDELPWQLAEAAAWKRLRNLLIEPDFFTRAWDANQFDVKAYWARIEHACPLQMSDAYRPVIQHPEAEHSWQVATLLHDAGHLSEALTLWAELIEHYRRTGDRDNLARSLGNQAVILQSRGQLDQAMDLHKEEEEICRELADDAGLANSLSNQAVLLKGRWQLGEALSLFQEAERICRELDDRRGLATCVGNQAVILQIRGDLHQALSLHEEEERILRGHDDRAGVAGCLTNQAAIFHRRGDLDQAMALFQDAERIYRNLGDRARLAVILGNRAVIGRARGDLDHAMTLHQEEERICREIDHPRGLFFSLGNQAAIHSDRGELDQAMALFEEGERICRELNDPGGLATCIGHQAIFHRERGNLDRAVALHTEEERICREIGDRAGLQRSLSNQAVILQSRGQLDQATALQKEAEEICRELGDRRGLHSALSDQAVIAQEKGDLDRAMTLYIESERTCRELEDPAGLAISLANQSNLLLGLGESGKALRLAQEAYELVTLHGLTKVAQQIEPILESVRSKAS